MKQDSRNFWPSAIIGWFVLFFLITVGLVCMASRQNEDLVQNNYYDEEIQFQRQLDRMNRTAAAGAKAAVKYNPAEQSLVVSLPPAVARLHPSGKINLYRPSDASLDREFAFVPDEEGVQRLDASRWRAGLWKVRLGWNLDGEEFYSDQAVVIGR